MLKDKLTLYDEKQRDIIDGVHRYKVLELLENENYKIPAKLPCTFIKCKDKKEASKLVLIYSYIYAKIQDEGLYEFLNIENLDLNELKDWPEHIKEAQRNWIGKSVGTTVKFEIRSAKSETNSKSKTQNSKLFIEVFTTRIDTIFGCTYVVLAPESKIIEELKIEGDLKRDIAGNIKRLKDIKPFLIMYYYLPYSSSLRLKLAHASHCLNALYTCSASLASASTRTPLT